MFLSINSKSAFEINSLKNHPTFSKKNSSINKSECLENFFKKSYILKKYS